jgi:predicted PurR-regulated permease PerM
MDKDRGPFLSNPLVARASRWGLLAWSVIGLLILVALVYRFVLYPIRIIFAPLVVALIVIYLLDPVVTRLQARGVRRVWGTLLVYVVFLSVVGVALAYLAQVVGHQVNLFVRSVPDLLAKAQVGLASLFDRLGLHVDTKVIVAAFEPQKGTAFLFLGRITSFTSGVLHVALILILGPIIGFYLLVDLPKIRRGAQSLVPASRREEARALAGRVGQTLGEFFRGQLLLAFLVGLASMLGFYVVGVPYFALLGALTGLFALVPLIGTLIAAIPVLFVALTASGRSGPLLRLPGGWRLALGCTIVLILVQQLDNRVLARRVKSRAVRLHPVTVLLSLLVGGSLLGLWGMLLAVPTVAALKAVVLYLWDTRSQWPPRAEATAQGGSVDPDGAIARPPGPVAAPAAEREAGSNGARMEREPARRPRAGGG